MPNIKNDCVDNTEFYGVPILNKTFICLYNADPGYIDICDDGFVRICSYPYLVILFDYAITKRLVSESNINGYLKCLKDEGYVDISDKFQKIDRGLYV